MSIRDLQENEIDKAVELCVDSFYDHDTLMHDSYGSSSSNKRELMTHLYTNYFLQTNKYKHHIYYSDLDETEKDEKKHKEHMRSVALVFPAGSPWPLDDWNDFVKDHLKLISSIDVLGNDTIKYRFELLEDWFDEQREDLNQIDSYYIVLVATDSNYRKKGYASKLINHVLALADTNGKKCYLECSETETYYEKFGFKTIKKASPTRHPQEDPQSDNHNNPPTLWFMERPPQK